MIGNLNKYCLEKKNKTKYRYDVTEKVMIDVTFVILYFRTLMRQ